MFIKKAHAGNAPGYSWQHDGQVIDVHDDLAVQLLNIPHGGFTLAPEPVEETPPEDTIDPGWRHTPDPEPEPEPRRMPKSPGRPRLPRDADGNIIRN